MPAVVLLAACGAPDSAKSPNPEPHPAAANSPDGVSTPAGDSIGSAERLAGEYRIAGVDGAALDLPYGVTASISENRIHVVADCINMAWSYRFSGASLATERVAVEGCARGLMPQEQAIADAFDAASKVSVNRANGLDFEGAGHSVTLFTQ